jgi:NAD(P) transhydrogenase subunit alpha
MTVVRHVDGVSELTWPPPPVQVSAAPVPVPQSDASAVLPVPPTSRRSRTGLVLAAAVLLFAAIAVSPPALQARLTVFGLAVVIGFYVIGHVHHALHTPLMSVTNAISGIIVVGALLQVGQGDGVITPLASVAILLASVNVFGGFAVTRRMLAMFSRS